MPMARARAVMKPTGVPPGGADAVRERFLAGHVEPLAERLGGDSNARVRAELVISALSGLAASLRIFRLPSVQADIDEVAVRYGRLVQALIDS